MNKKLLLLIFCLVFFSVYASENTDTLIPNEIQLNKEESQKKTLLGDLTNTNEYLDFLHIHSEAITSEIIFWEQIAAENELINKHTQEVNIHMYNYALTLREIEKDNVRAVFWVINSNIKESDSVYQKIVKPYQNLLEVTINIEHPKTISELNDLAKIGSKEAARELYKYYINKKDKNSALYWLRIGAQNGDIDCINDYILLLKQSSKDYDKLRVKIWEKWLL